MFVTLCWLHLRISRQSFRNLMQQRQTMLAISCNTNNATLTTEEKVYIQFEPGKDLIWCPVQGSIDENAWLEKVLLLHVSIHYKAYQRRSHKKEALIKNALRFGTNVFLTMKYRVSY